MSFFPCLRNFAGTHKERLPCGQSYFIVRCQKQSGCSDIERSQRCNERRLDISIGKDLGIIEIFWNSLLLQNFHR